MNTDPSPTPPPRNQPEDFTPEAGEIKPAGAIVKKHPAPQTGYEATESDKRYPILVWRAWPIKKDRGSSTHAAQRHDSSLSANANYGPDNTSFAIRGFVQDLGTAPSVGVYFADVVAVRGPSGAGTQAGDTAGPGDFFDLQNISSSRARRGRCRAATPPAALCCSCLRRRPASSRAMSRGATAITT